MSDEEILTQDEKDALVNQEGTDDAAEANDDGEITTIDFASQGRIVRSQFPVLERIHERLTRRFSAAIYDLMGREVEITMDTLKIEKYQEFMCSLAIPSGINIIRMHPFRGKALIVFDADLVFAIVDNYFGGKGAASEKTEEREFTLTEIRVTKTIVNELVANLKEAWSPILDIEVEPIHHEMNSQLVNIASPSDVMMVSPFEISFGEQSGKFYIATPYAMLEPVREQLELGSARSDDDIDPNWIKSLREELLDVELGVSSILVETELNLREVMNLKAGEIIPVDMPETVKIDVEGMPRFEAKFGAAKDKCALKVIGQLSD